MKEIKISDNITVTVANATYRGIKNYCEERTADAQWLATMFVDDDPEYELWVCEENAKWAKMPTELRMAECAVSFLFARDVWGRSYVKKYLK